MSKDTNVRLSKLIMLLLVADIVAWLALWPQARKMAKI
jgi:hypothetical protein